MSRARTGRGARGRMGADAMAGWLFADLLLVLFVIGLGSQLTLFPSPEPAPEPTVSESPEPSPEPTETPGPPTMRQEPEVIEVAVNPDALLRRDPGEVARLAAEVDAKTAGFAESQAVLVLLFGYADNATAGQAIATAVGDVLVTRPAPFTPDTKTRPLWQGGAAGTVRLEIFLLDNPPEAE